MMTAHEAEKVREWQGRVKKAQDHLGEARVQLELAMQDMRDEKNEEYGLNELEGHRAALKRLQDEVDGTLYGIMEPEPGEWPDELEDLPVHDTHCQCGERIGDYGCPRCGE